MSKYLLKELGFKQTLNAAGHVTIYGGSCPSPEVVRAMNAASNIWIDMRVLEKNAGKLLASYLGCDDGIVTSGAYAANTIAAHTALSLAKQKGSIPDVPNIVIQTSHITKYAEAFVTGGIRLKEIRRNSKDQSLSEYIDKSTIAVAYVVNDLDLEFSLLETVKASRQAGVSAIVDAAVVDPVVRGAKEILAYGPDCVSISGGKGLNGPNATGLLIGRSEFVARARDLAFPNYGPGRGMKVSKEQIVGLMTAVKVASELDDQKVIQGWKNRVEKIRAGLAGIPHLRTEMLFPWNLNFPQPIPRVGISIETQDGESKAEEVKRRLTEGSPQVLVRPYNDVQKAKNTITLDIRPLQANEIRLLIESLRAVLVTVTKASR